MALVVSTAGELLSPVIIRRAIDDALMKSWYGFSAAVRGSEADKTLKVTDADPEIAGTVYLRTSRLSGLSAEEKARLQAEGIFNPKEMYVFKAREGDGAQAALRAARPELFPAGSPWGVISTEELRALPAAEAAGLRAADSALIGRYVVTLLIILAAVLVSTFLMIYLSNLLGLKIMKDPAHAALPPCAHPILRLPLAPARRPPRDAPHERRRDDQRSSSPTCCPPSSRISR